jgi:hypothetical protein
MTNFVGPVYELFCRKPKICNGFWKTNFETELNIIGISEKARLQSGAGQLPEILLLDFYCFEDLTWQNR